MRGGLGGLYFKFYIYRSVLALDMRGERKNAQNAPEHACSLFWQSYPDRTQKRAQRIQAGQKWAILQMFASQAKEKPAPLHQARWAGWCSSCSGSLRDACFLASVYAVLAVTHA